MNSTCEYCGKLCGGSELRKSHEKYCIEQYFKISVPQSEYCIYIFTFIADGTQRYYVGQTRDPVARAKAHVNKEPKKLYKHGEKNKIENEDIEPIDWEIIDTANSLEGALVKERQAFIDMVREVEDGSMVCGGM